MRKRVSAVVLLVCACLVLLGGRAGAQSPTPPYPVPPESVLNFSLVYSTVAQATSSADEANDAYTSAQDFESNATNEVCEDHGLTGGPTCTSNMILSWARSDLVAQEWADLAEIISDVQNGELTCPSGVIESPGTTASDQCNIYNWFIWFNQQQQVTADQDAIQEYANWAATTTSDLTATPAPVGPNGTGFCNFQPPGEPSSNFTYTGNQNPICYGSCPEELEAIGGCDAVYPPEQDFVAWGEYEAQSTAESTPGWNNTMTAAAAATAALVLPAAGVAVTPIVAATGATGLAGTALQQALLPAANQKFYQFTRGPRAPSQTPQEDVAEDAPDDGPSELASDAGEAASDAVEDTAQAIADASATAEVAGAIAFVIGIVVFAIATIATEIYTIATDAAIPGQLESNLANDRSSAPGVTSLVGSAANYATGLSEFTFATNDDAPAPCYGPTSSGTPTNGDPTCTDAPAPLTPTASDPGFELSAAGGVPQAAQSLYVVAPAGVFDTVQISNDAWFAIQHYDSSNPANATSPGAGEGQAALQSFSVDYLDWNGDPWQAELVTTPGSDVPEFAISPESSAEQSACTPPSGTNPCFTSTLQYQAPNGWTGAPLDESATIEPSSALSPTVQPWYNTPTYVGTPVQFHGNGSDPSNLPLSYTWTFPTQWYDGTITCGGGVNGPNCTTIETGPNPTFTFTLSGQQLVSVTATDTSGYSSTTTFPVDIGDQTTTTLQSSADPSVYGQPVSVTATVSPDNPENNLFNQGDFPPATGYVQFYLNGSALGQPVPVQDQTDPNPLDQELLSPVGTASIALPTLSPDEQQQIDAVYFGDSNYSASGYDPTGVVGVTDPSGQLNQTVNPAETSVTVTSSPNPSLYGDPVTLAADVTATPPALGTPTGYVQFLADGSAIGGFEPLNSEGEATLTTDTTDVLDQTGSGTSFPNGHDITAEYVGPNPTCGIFCVNPGFGFVYNTTSASGADLQDVEPPPSPPVVVNQSVGISPDTCATLNPLHGATDVDDSIVASTLQIVSGVTSPDTLTNNGDGTVRFCSHAGGPSTDVFTFEVENTGAYDPVTNPTSTPQTSNVGTFTITMAKHNEYAYANGGATSPSRCPIASVAASECTLTQALALAPSGGSVVLETPGSTASYTGNFTVSSSVTLLPGTGVSGPILDGGGSGTVLSVPSGGSITDLSVTIKGITIQHGNGYNGGGLYVDGKVSLVGVTITANSANEGGGVYLDVAGVLEANQSSVTNNSAGAGGGLLVAGSSFSIVKSTIADNSASAFGGGILTVAPTGSILSSTLYGDSAQLLGSEVASLNGAVDIVGTTLDGTSSPPSYPFPDGGGIVAPFGGSISMAGSIISSSNGDDCFGPIADGGFNLESDGGNTCSLSSTDHDLVGVDPGLGGLASNGGPTATDKPVSNSAALDQIPPGTTVTVGGIRYHLCPTTDQRGDRSGDSPYGCAVGSVQETNGSLPIVTAISPRHGTVAGGTSVTLRGLNLSDVTSVTFGGLTATTVVVTPSGTITVILPPGTATGSVPVVVTTPAGSSPWRPRAEFRYT